MDAEDTSKVSAIIKSYLKNKFFVSTGYYVKDLVKQAEQNAELIKLDMQEIIELETKYKKKNALSVCKDLQGISCALGNLYVKLELDIEVEFI